jgi:hypothetical protein
VPAIRHSAAQQAPASRLPTNNCGSLPATSQKRDAARRGNRVLLLAKRRVSAKQSDPDECDRALPRRAAWIGATAWSPSRRVSIAWRTAKAIVGQMRAIRALQGNCRGRPDALTVVKAGAFRLEAGRAWRPSALCGTALPSLGRNCL